MPPTPDLKNASVVWRYTVPASRFDTCLLYGYVLEKAWQKSHATTPSLLQRHWRSTSVDCVLRSCAAAPMAGWTSHFCPLHHSSFAFLLLCYSSGENGLKRPEKQGLAGWRACSCKRWRRSCPSGLELLGLGKLFTAVHAIVAAGRARGGPRAREAAADGARFGVGLQLGLVPASAWHVHTHVRVCVHICVPMQAVLSWESPLLPLAPPPPPPRRAPLVVPPL